MVEYMTELLLWRYLNCKSKLRSSSLLDRRPTDAQIGPDDEFTGVVPDGMSQIQSPALEQNTTEEFRQGLAQRNEDFKKALSTNNDGATATPLKDASDVHWGPSPQRLVKDDDAASDRSDVVWTRPQYLQNGSEKIAEDTHSEPPRNAASDCSDVLWIPSQLRQPEIAT